MTRSVDSWSECTCIALLGFKIDAGDLVDVLDADEPVVEMASMVGSDAHLQLCVFVLVSGLKR